MNSNYNKNLKENARILRPQSSPGEIILWNNALKNKQLLGYQFLGQYPTKNYIVYFICCKAKLIIEVDGYSYNFKYEKDPLRDNYLNELGYKV